MHSLVRGNPKIREIESGWSFLGSFVFPKKFFNRDF